MLEKMQEDNSNKGLKLQLHVCFKYNSDMYKKSSLNNPAEI